MNIHKFKDRYFNMMVPEWRNGYLNYRYLKEYIKPLKYLSRRAVNVEVKIGTKSDKLSFKVTNLSEELRKRISQTSEIVTLFYQQEFKKINTFFQYKLLDITKRWLEIKTNCIALVRVKDSKKYQQMRQILLIIYKEIYYLSQFLILNEQANKRLTHKLSSYVKDTKPNFKMPEIKRFIKKNAPTSFLFKNGNKLTILSNDVQLQYDILFFHQKDRKQAEKELNLSAAKSVISQKESLMFGIFLGFLILSFIILITFQWVQHYSIDADPQLKVIFPIFRATLLLIMYQWLLTWNVYGWTKYNINYKLIFKFNHHFSQVSQLLKRSAFFTLVWVIVYLLFIMDQALNIVSYYFGNDPQYYPLLVWVFLFTYFLYPSRNKFNAKGRLYCLRYFKMIICFFCYECCFIKRFISDQFVSFVSITKDISYTICFYNQSYNTKIEEKILIAAKCNDTNKLSVGFIAALIPYFFRMIQCVMTMNQDRKFGTEIWNFLKYFLSFLTALLSYLHYLLDKQDSSYDLLKTWIILASITTLYSYYWDLKMDWGLLDPGQKKHPFLRKELSYNNATFYYTAMLLNLVLRLSWVLSISPNIVQTMGFQPDMFLFAVSFGEMIRRCVWNFFRVEKQHIHNQQTFQAVQDYTLPFKDIEIDQKQLGLVFVEQQFQKFNFQQEDQQPVQLQHCSLFHSFRMSFNMVTTEYEEPKSFIQNKLSKSPSKSNNNSYYDEENNFQGQMMISNENISSNNSLYDNNKMNNSIKNNYKKITQVQPSNQENSIYNMIEQKISKETIKRLEEEFQNSTKKLVTIESIQENSQQLISVIKKQFKTNLYINSVVQQNLESLYDQYQL